MSDPSRPSGKSTAVHIPVLLREVLQALELQPGLIVVDGTVGAAGHSREIVTRIGPEGTLIGLDRDPMMLAHAGKHLQSPNCHLVHASYAQLKEVLANLQIEAVDRILLDLGLSSDQLSDEQRGFSFHATGPLDLRFDTTRGEAAWELLNHISEEDLANILHQYGEEPNSRRLARQLVEWRAGHSLKTAVDLSQAVAAATGARHIRGGERHPATRVFQALRIAVNEELQQLEQALGGVIYDSLKPGGIAAIISFHSLEDRLVKHAFRDATLWQTLTPKPVVASTAEQRINPRSRTAKLRAAKKR